REDFVQRWNCPTQAKTRLEWATRQSLGPQPLWRKSGASALPRTSLPLTEPSLLSRGTRGVVVLARCGPPDKRSRGRFEGVRGNNERLLLSEVRVLRITWGLKVFWVSGVHPPLDRP